MLEPCPRIGRIHVHQADVGIGVALLRRPDDRVDRIRYQERVFDDGECVVVDECGAGQFLAGRECGAEDDLVIVTEYMRPPHGPVDVDAGGAGDPRGQGVWPCGDFVPAPLLHVGVVEEFTEHSEQRGRLAGVGVDEAVHQAGQVNRLPLGTPR